MGEYSIDDTFLALADPTRREILGKLARGRMRVTDVARPFAISLNSISKHIRILERAGLVQRTRQGREHLLQLNISPLDRTFQWMEKNRTTWNSRLDTLQELLADEDQKNPNRKKRGTK